jgi:glucosamine-6-phosphate deaminase
LKIDVGISEGGRMLVVLKRDYSDLAREAASFIAKAVRANPSLRLGLATGTTMLGMYQELARRHQQEGLDFSRIVTFSLDEYLGLKSDHPRSFRRFMQENFFSRVNMDPRNIHFPDGTITDAYDEYCASYEQAIRAAGGIDLQVLGIGRNGHIGFNEPTSSLASRTRLKVLSPETLDDNRKFFGPGETVPRCAITMGIGTILESRRIILLATGLAKAGAIAAAIEGPVTASVTASALQLHPDVTFILDEEAASRLKQKEYYRQVLEMTAILVPSRLS